MARSMKSINDKFTNRNPHNISNTCTTNKECDHAIQRSLQAGY